MPSLYHLRRRGWLAAHSSLPASESIGAACQPVAWFYGEEEGEQPGYLLKRYRPLNLAAGGGEAPSQAR